MTYKIVDLETSGKKEYGRICNPLNPEHEVNVYAEASADGSTRIETDYEGDLREYVDMKLEGVTHLIGQNFKFDLLYMWKTPQLQKFIADGGKIWDTRTAEYFLKAHDNKNNNLNELSEKYGGKQKIDEMKDMYNQGLTTAEIGREYPEMMSEYAEGDVLNTRVVAQGQAKAARKKSCLPAMEVYMDHILALCEMEYNGISLDLELGMQRAHETQVLRDGVLSDICILISDIWPQELKFRPTDRMVSAVLFSEELPHFIQTPNPTKTGVTHYKSGKNEGKLRTKKTETRVPVPGYALPRTLSPDCAHGWKQVGEKVLKTIRDKHPKTKEFIDLLLKYRGYDKTLTTYYLSYPDGNIPKGRVQKGLFTLIQEHDGLLHPEFNPASTVTGRLSSKNPNGQNMGEHIQELMVSRWKDKGVIIEADYSQLEVVVQAWLSNCTGMLKDITNGVDFHCKRLGYYLDEDYNSVVKKCKVDKDPNYIKMRKNIAKPISFQKSYGAMPESIARDTGLSVQAVEKVFAREDEEYPEIPTFCGFIREQVSDSRIPVPELQSIFRSRKFTEGELPAGFYEIGKGVIRHNNEQGAYGYYTSEFGQTWRFQEKAKVSAGGKVFRYFNTPEMQNYCVQGTAALLVKMQTARVFREYAIKHRDTMLMIGEIHDALLIDCKESHAEEHAAAIKSIMEDVRGTVLQRFGMRFDAPISVDVGIGRTWKQAKEEG